MILKVTGNKIKKHPISQQCPDFKDPPAQWPLRCSGQWMGCWVVFGAGTAMYCTVLYWLVFGAGTVLPELFSLKFECETILFLMYFYEQSYIGMTLILVYASFQTCSRIKDYAIVLKPTAEYELRQIAQLFSALYSITKFLILSASMTMS